jgi:DNA processing protein
LAETDDDQRLLNSIQLAMVPGVGPQISQALLARFETAARALEASRAELLSVSGVGPKIAEKIARARQDFDAAAELALCRRSGVGVISRGDPEYPPPLENIPDPPGLLYVKGAILPRDQLAIAVVGSRHCTPYGTRMAERLSSALARTGFTVVSGLARGIDAAAHRGAIKAGGRTIAVLANGLASVYPPEHDELARSVVEAGALVSEMPMRQSPLAGLFTHENAPD